MKTISEVKQEFELAKGDREKLYLQYTDDTRQGVKNLIQKYKRADRQLQLEYKRLEMMSTYEKMHEKEGLICGIDEAGRGPLAGPVVAAAVILPKDCKILYLNDSKKLTAKRRDSLFDEIQEKAIAVGVGIVGSERIDEINILQATYEAMKMAVANLKYEPNLLLNDAVTIPNLEIPQIPIIHGDAKSVSIAAASIIAKVTRDRMMAEYDKIFPEYGFADNKGYGSASHIEALKENGPSFIHRRSFLKNFMNDFKE
ncbi:MAG: ribonuclease HII [Candidatus Ruminococcus intestinipullorum]|nr:ribonuclease HII [Candidatus Ruminococcus intestinipullorum]